MRLAEAGGQPPASGRVSCTPAPAPITSMLVTGPAAGNYWSANRASGQWAPPGGPACPNPPPSNTHMNFTLFTHTIFHILLVNHPRETSSFTNIQSKCDSFWMSDQLQVNSHELCLQTMVPEEASVCVTMGTSIYANAVFYHLTYNGFILKLFI